MKLSFRISVILSLISVSTIGIISILMHFRYHMNCTTLFNDRLNITSRSIIKYIDTNLRSGLPINSQYNLENYIKMKHSIHKDIEGIYILEIKNFHPRVLFKTTSKQLSKDAQDLIIRKIKSSKTSNWSEDLMENNQDWGYNGLTIKNTKEILGAVVVLYDNMALLKKQKTEIHMIYKRMIIAMLISVFFSMCIGYYGTRPLIKMINDAEDGIKNFLTLPSHHFFAYIYDPELKRDMDYVIRSMKQIDEQLAKMEYVLDKAEYDLTCCTIKEDDHV